MFGSAVTTRTVDWFLRKIVGKRKDQRENFSPRMRRVKLEIRCSHFQSQSLNSLFHIINDFHSLSSPNLLSTCWILPVFSWCLEQITYDTTSLSLSLSLLRLIFFRLIFTLCGKICFDISNHEGEMMSLFRDVTRNFYNFISVEESP